MRAFNVGFGVLRTTTAHCISVVGAWLGTRGSALRTSVDGTCGGALSFTDGGGSANSVVDIVRTEVLKGDGKYEIPSDTGRNSTIRQLLPPAGYSMNTFSRPSSGSFLISTK